MTGRTISHYEVVEKLGEGGMGVVYKARDAHLDRFVAIKVLPAERVADPERRRRFVQEAKAASALNHPNIVHIYDIDQADAVDFIAMEYVEGKTLDELIGRKGLRLGDALKYGVQIADALSRAHAAGIIHRDLKPGNIMVDEHGLVKVLDFGLAKLTETDLPGEDQSTRTLRPTTEEGTIVGTVAYMSPEQAQGKRLDARSDIFSFGAVLYEMLTGSRAFQKESKTSTLVAILTQEPTPLAGEIPHDVETVVTRCLRKDIARRYQHVDDVKIALEELKEQSDSGELVSEVPAAILRPGRLPVRRIAVVVILLASLGSVLWLYWHSASKRFGRASPEEKTGGGRLSLLVSSEGQALDPALSPDGKMIAYVAEEQKQWDLFAARVAGGDRVRLTNDEARESTPSFSPDGEYLAFTRTGTRAGSTEVWVVPVLGGRATRLLADAAHPTWSPDGTRIAFVSRQPAGDVVATCDADGSDVRAILGSQVTHPFIRHTTWSPDGSQLAFVRSTGGAAGELWLVPVQGGSPRRLTNDVPGVFSDSPVFTRDGRGLVHQSNRAGATNLWLLPVGGGPLVRLTEGPGPDESPSVARDGSIAFINLRARCALLLQELASGQTREILTHSHYIWSPAFSPDGRDLAFSRGEKDGAWHIWIVPVRGGASQRLTSGLLPEVYPRFTPDGASVVYHTWSPGPDRIWHVPRAGGPAEPMTPARGEDDGYADVSPDGRWLAFARTDKEGTRIHVAPVNGGEARRLTDSASTTPRWSPDGRWIAFSPSRDCAAGIFVVGADGARMRRLSETGGWPVWWPDGGRVGYQDIGPDGSEEILTTPLAGGSAGRLRGLRFDGNNYPFDISADGRLLATSNCVTTSSEIWLLGRRP